MVQIAQGKMKKKMNMDVSVDSRNQKYMYVFVHSGTPDTCLLCVEYHFKICSNMLDVEDRILSDVS